MNNYSFLSKVLHRQFLKDGVLSDLLIKKIQSRKVSIDFSDGNHIFITGLARSGTTAILNSLDSSNIFASLRYKYMPFILYPLMAKIYIEFFSSNKTEAIPREHGDGIYISQNSCECLDEPYWKNNPKNIINKNNDGLHPIDLEKIALDGYSNLLNQFMKIEGRKRFLIKNNNHHLRLNSLTSYFKNSKFIILFRSPLFQAISLLNTHKKFISLQKKDYFVYEYMNMLCHREFGLGIKPFIYKDYQNEEMRLLKNESINYWIQQWINTYSYILTEINPIKNVYLVCYESLCNEKYYYQKLLNFINIDINSLNCDLNLANYKYDLEFKDVDQERLSKANNIYNQLMLLSNKKLNYI